MAGRLLGSIRAWHDDVRRDDRAAGPHALLAPDATPDAWALLDLLPDGVVGVDPGGVIVAANPRAHELFGYEPGELIGLLVDDLLPERFRGAHRRHRRGYAKKPWTRPMGAGLELSGLRKDGTELPVEISLSPIRIGADMVVVATVRDVSDRRRASALLTMEKHLLETIASGAPLERVLETVARAIEEADPSCLVSILLLDEQGERLRHGAAPSLPPEYVRRIDGMAIGPAAGTCGTAAFRGEPVITTDIRTDPLWERSRDALRFGLAACWSVPILSGSGRVLGTFAVYHREPRAPDPDERDLVERAKHITGIAIERARAEAKMKESEDRYRAISELTSDYSYSLRVAPNGRLDPEWVTEAFTRITGYEPHELTEGWKALLHPDELAAAHERYRRVVAGQVDVDEFRIVTKSGEVRWIRNYSRPVWDVEQQRVVRILGAAQDVTERKKAEEAKTLFLATASHELKTPLTVIQGFAQLLSNPQTPKDMHDEALRAIERRAVQLNKIVDRILLSSRIESGRTDVTVTQVDAVPILRERIDTLRRSSGRPLTLELEDALPSVSADPDALTTVVDHLLDNALKYSPDGGPIEVRARVVGAHVRITVADHGVGMTPEQLAHCFDKFWQGESSDRRRFGGTGIGLYIVRSLVEAMGGSIAVESERGVGTTFEIDLLVDLPSGNAPEPEPTGEGAAHPSVILEVMRHIGVPRRRPR